MEFKGTDMLGTIIQASQGIGIWVIEAVILLGVIFLVFKGFKRVPAWSKGIVLVVVLGLVAVLDWEMVELTRTHELNTRPDQVSFDLLPASEVEKSSLEPGETGGWIHCGDFNSATNRWPKRYVSITGPSAGAVPASLVSHMGNSPITLGVFDSPPRFSWVNLKWDFGGFNSDLKPYEEIKILEIRHLGNGRVWCKMERVGGK